MIYLYFPTGMTLRKPSAERGGRRKRIYKTTASGQKSLEASRDLKVSLWNKFLNFAIDKLSFGK